MQQIDTLFIGSSTRDLLMQVTSPPASDQRLTATSFSVACGGVSATAAAAHRKLGGSTGVITAVGDDETGSFIKTDLEAQQLDYLKVFTFPGRFSSTSMIQVEENGKRCLTCFGGCIDALSFGLLDREILQRAKVVHLGVMPPEIMLQLCRYCKEHTAARVSIDGGNLPRAVMERLLPDTDLFIPDNKTAMKTLGLEPEAACRWYVEHGAGLACVTAAEKGTWAFDGSRICHAGTIPVNVLDTTGAGDNFHGAFLYCVSRGWDLDFSLRFANIFASLTCEGMGGRSAVPSLEKVLALCRS
jgi:sugar/nucleoside kinase (ribokinase family)